MAVKTSIKVEKKSATPVSYTAEELGNKPGVYKIADPPDLGIYKPNAVRIVVLKGIQLYCFTEDDMVDLFHPDCWSCSRFEPTDEEVVVRFQGLKGGVK